MRRIVIVLLSMLSLSVFAEEKTTLVIPKDKVGTHVLMGSRIVHVNKPCGKVFADGQRNHIPSLMVITADSAGCVVLRREAYTTPDGLKMKTRPHKGKGKGRGPAKAVVLPIVASDADSYTVDVSEYFSDYPEEISAIPPKMLKGPAVTHKIMKAKSFEDYLQVTARYTYEDGLDATANCYILFLDETPSDIRIVDKTKAGYSFVEYRDTAGRVDVSLRWDLAKTGKIVFYVDRRFPNEWYPYIKEGIEDWNKTFEAIGMEDVIEVLPEPADGKFDRFAPLVNMVRFMDVEEHNAKGDVLYDPRSGQILQGDILWWKDALKLICEWRYIQTGAADGQARLQDYPIEIIGPMVRHAICHEMGHVLGLSHNMGASWAYPADSLLSPTFTAQYGTAASVMDYARYNHLATEADVARGVGLLPPRVGPYDYYAIAMGYAPEGSAVPGKYCYFAPFISAAISPDPSSQSETLGNDLLRSSASGLRNCRMLLQLDGLDDVRLKQIQKHYYRYIMLSLSNIGGKVGDKPVGRRLRRRTVRFVMEALHDAPAEIADEKKQEAVIRELEGNFLPKRVEENNGKGGLRNYTRQVQRLKKKYSFNQNLTN